MHQGHRVGPRPDQAGAERRPGVDRDPHPAFRLLRRRCSSWTARTPGWSSLLSRTPGIDRGLLTRLGGPGFVDRALEAGVLLRRQAAAGFDVVAGATVPPAPVAAEVSGQLASALIDRGRPVDAVGLLVDAGAHERAARELMELPESVTREVEPRVMLSLLARLGTVIEREPALLLKRAASSVYIGRVDLARADIDRALELAVSAEPPMRRRITVEAAEWMLLQGRTDEAVSSGPGRDHRARSRRRPHLRPCPCRAGRCRVDQLQSGVVCIAPPSGIERRRRRGKAVVSSPRRGSCRCDLATPGARAARTVR